MTVFEVAVDDTDCDDDVEEEGVNRDTEGIRPLPLTLDFDDFELGLGDRGVAVWVELLDSEEIEGAGEAVRDESAERGGMGDWAARMDCARDSAWLRRLRSESVMR